mgnify:CR=1 FL=1
MSQQVDKSSPKDVRRVATLARLGLTEEEVTKAAKDLGNVLEYFSRIQTINTKGVPTSDDITGSKNVTRADEANPELLCSTESLLGAVPETQDNQIKVKSVFK